MRILTFAVVLAWAVATLAEAAPPVPIYSSHIIEKMPYSANTFLLKTSDALDTVTDFYRSRLKGMSSEHKDAEGSIFYVTNGATVTITPGNHFDPGTAISYSWDAGKFGPVPVRR